MKILKEGLGGLRWHLLVIAMNSWKLIVTKRKGYCDSIEVRALALLA